MTGTEDRERPVPAQFGQRVPILVDASDRTAVIVDDAIDQSA